MTTAVFEKRLRALEEEVEELKRESVKRPAFPVFSTRVSKTKKKLPKGILAGLRDLKAGRVSGPFNTAKALMAHLER